MKHVVKVAALLTLALYAGIPAVAQAPRPMVVDPQNGLTLEQAIAEGLRAEPTIAAARLDIDAAKGDRRQAALRPNPMLSFGEREQVGGADRQTTIDVDVPIDAFRRKARMASADRGVEATEAAVRDRERLLAAAIRERYGDVLTALRRLEIIDAGIVSNRRTYELLRSRAAEGAAPPLDRDIALVELRRLLGERELAAGHLNTALIDLKQLLGRLPDAPLTLAVSLEMVVHGSLGQEVTGPPGQRSDVREAAAQVSLAQARTREAAQEGQPEISLFGSYMRMDEGFPQRGFGASGALEPIHGVFHNVAGGIRVSLPIFNRGQGATLAAQARERAAAELLRARELAVASELASARVRVAAARRVLEAYSEETLTLVRRNLEVVRETYSLGRATLFDVLNEQRRFLEFEAGHTEALAEMFAAQTALRRATGEVQ
jgi:cobalt-zinc-cadmium efflux system outer membrane protein